MYDAVHGLGHVFPPSVILNLAQNQVVLGAFVGKHAGDLEGLPAFEASLSNLDHPCD
jgi:hypothetical protein